MLRISIFVCAILIFTASVRAEQQYLAVLSGQQEVPANNSTAKGFCVFTLLYNDFIYTCKYSGMSGGVTATSVHMNASVGENAPVLYPLEPTTGTDGEFIGYLGPIPNSFIDRMRNNRWYVNFSSENFPNGEIRGQQPPRAPSTGKKLSLFYKAQTAKCATKPSDFQTIFNK